MIAGLLLPHLTEADPELAGEGSLDPLGLAALAERLAEGIAPNVTARMSRMRFITAMALSASVTQGMDELPPGDGISTPYLAFEWHVVTAFARDQNLPAAAIDRTPGIMKARAAIARNKPLDAASYLKAPKVFGFNGVYKRLAKAIGIVDDNLILAEQGDQLLRCWEREQGFLGFADRRSDSDGGRFARALQAAVRDAYKVGRSAETYGSHLWVKIVRALRLDSAGVEEREILWKALAHDQEPIRAELARLIRRSGSFESEWELLRRIHDRTSAGLRARLDAVDAYEHVAELLTRALDVLRYVGTALGGPVLIDEFAKHAVVKESAKRLPSALRQAATKLESLDPTYGLQLDDALGSFFERRSPELFIETLLSRHQDVQAAKLPDGKRPWFESTERGLILRPPYKLDDEPEIAGAYIHPYRIWALSRFIQDIT